MKTWEVYKMGLENRNLKFVYKGVHPFNDVVAHFNFVGKLVDEHDSLFYPTFESDWELVREQVDFVTAIKAYVEGKSITSDTATYYPSMHGYDTDSISSIGVSFREIINNEWYIEEGIK